MLLRRQPIQCANAGDPGSNTQACASESCGHPQILQALGNRFYQEVLRCEYSLVYVPVFFPEVGQAALEQACGTGLPHPGVSPTSPARALGSVGSSMA